MRWPRSRGSAPRRCASSSPSAQRERPVQGSVRFRRAGSTPGASTAASSRTSSRPAPSKASTRTGRRASPPPNCCCARRAAPPRSARTGRRACSPASPAWPMPALPRARHCRWWPIGRRSSACRTSSTAIGFYLSSHPLDPYGRSLERAGILRWVDLPAALAARRPPPASASPASSSARRSAPRRAAAALPLSSCRTPRGVFEVTLFSEVLGQARALLDSGQPLIVTVDVRREEENLRLTAQKIEPLDSVVAHAAAGLRVFVGEAEALPRLKSLIGARGRRPRPGHGRARPAEQRGRDRAPRRLPRRPQDPRRRQIAAGHRRRPRYLIAGAKLRSDRAGERVWVKVAFGAACSPATSCANRSAACPTGRISMTPPLKRFGSDLRRIFDRFPTAQSPNESQTEDDLIWPILDRARMDREPAAAEPRTARPRGRAGRASVRRRAGEGASQRLPRGVAALRIRPRRRRIETVAKAARSPLGATRRRDRPVDADAALSAARRRPHDRQAALGDAHQWRPMAALLSGRAVGLGTVFRDRPGRCPGHPRP